MERTKMYLSIDDVVYKVALKYGNLYRGHDLEIWDTNPSQAKKEAAIASAGIGYQKKNDSAYIIYLILQPYVIEKGKDRFLFEGVPVGKDFQFKGHQIMFTGEPQVLRKEKYNHPFVYSGNTICFRSRNRWAEIGVSWNQWYDATQHQTIEKIAQWLEQGRFALQRGFLNNGGILSKETYRDEYIAAKTYRKAENTF